MADGRQAEVEMSGNRQISDEEIFDAAPDGLIVVDRTGRVIRANRAAVGLLGRGRAELMGQPFGEMAGGSQAADFAGRESVPPGEFLIRLANGSERTVEATASRTDSGGWVIIALRDITGRKREEEEFRVRARQQARVAELGRRALTGIDLDLLMDEAVRLLASDLGVEFVNLLELLPDGTAVFRAGVGWREGLIGGATVELMAGTPAGQVVLSQAPVLIEDLRTNDRFLLPSAARDHGVVSSLSVPLYGQGQPLGVLGVHSARRRSFPEADLHFVQAVANVVATVMDRQRDEERLRNQQMLRAEQMAAIGQVAAGVAHELRNPLTSVKGLVQVNLREADSRGLPTEDLRVIEHEVRRMERTLQTFLDFARPPRLYRQRLDLNGIVDRVTSLVGGRARKQTVQLNFARPSDLVAGDGDEDQLQQLILNLVLNALDALPSGGAIDIELRPPRDGLVELLVRDTGPGIAPNILPKVFETFVSSKETGIGLGLPVSRRIAEEHGGTLAAFNLPTGGACFVLRLPAPTGRGTGVASGGGHGQASGG
jgi:PAS domain S-box-containing protein